jgi:hypothetical protein
MIEFRFVILRKKFAGLCLNVGPFRVELHRRVVMSILLATEVIEEVHCKVSLVRPPRLQHTAPRLGTGYPSRTGTGLSPQR